MVVQDTGIGIPVDEQPGLFEKFFRSSTAQERAIQGTGLGLSIVAGIVAAHSGRIGVESAHLEGSTFTVRLPLTGGLTLSRLRPPTANRRGHQNPSPSRTAIAGTSTVRTRSVSSRTPIPITTPSWASTTRGSTPSTAKTAASRIPALVITPPVAASARSMPVRGVPSARPPRRPG